MKKIRNLPMAHKSRFNHLLNHYLKEKQLFSKIIDNPAELFAFFRSCEDFINLVFHHSDTDAEAQDFIHGLPKNKTDKDKYSIAIYNHLQQIIAVCDLIQDYPHKHIWYIGLLLISPALRQQGMGSFIFANLEKVILSLSGQEINLITQKQNPKATAFWKKHGFIITDESTQTLESGSNEILHLKKHYCFL